LFLDCVFEIGLFKFASIEEYPELAPSTYSQ